MSFVDRVGTSLQHFQEALHTQDSSDMPPRAAGGLDTLQGVFLPTFLSIWGVVVLVRMGFIVAQAGVWYSCLLWTLGYMAILVTALSLSAIATNGTVRGGGPYYMISRSLGPELGGSVGLCFYLFYCMNGVLNVLAFTEPISQFLSTAELSTQYYYGSLILVVCTVICALGPKAYGGAQSLLAFLLFIATLLIFFTFLLQEPFTTETTEYTSFRWETLWENWNPQFTIKEGTLHSSQTVFGVIFAACNGVLAGASMSGELQKPSRAIPEGTLWAVFITFIMHIATDICLGATTARLSLNTNYGILQDISIFPLLMSVGILATAAFGILNAVWSASSLLQAIALDHLLPCLNVFARNSGPSSQPLMAILATYILCQIIMLYDDFNFMASLVTIFSLLTFGGLNLACFLLRASNASNFRPTFKYFNLWTAFAGTILCFGLMLFLNAGVTFISFILLVILFGSIHFLTRPKPWGDISQSLIYFQVRKFLLLLDPRKQHPKYWRPNVLLLVGDALVQLELIKFCNSLKKGGLYVIGHAIVGDFTAKVVEYQKEERLWQKLVEMMHLKAFTDIVIAPTQLIGFQNILTSAGLGGMQPNIVVIPLPSSSMERGLIRPETLSELSFSMQREDSLTSAEINLLANAVVALDKTLVLAHGFPNMNVWHPHDSGGFVDLWPVQLSIDSQSHAKFNSYTMVLQMGCVLQTTQQWRHLKLRVHCFVEWQYQIEEEKERVQHLLEELRINATVSVWALDTSNLALYEQIKNSGSRKLRVMPSFHASSPERPSVFNRMSDDEQHSVIGQMLSKYSREAKVIITTMAVPRDERGCERLKVMAMGLPPIMFVHASTALAITTEL